MIYESIIEHMNEGHKDSLIALCRKFANVREVKDVYLKGVDLEGLDIVYDNNFIRVEFPNKATNETIKDAIISLCKSASSSKDLDLINKEIIDFRRSFKSINIATLNSDNKVIISYAPYIEFDNKGYIYISEVADHFDGIKTNPNNIEIMFIEDESATKNIIARIRLRYSVQATFIDRGSDEFNRIFDLLESSNSDNSAIKTIRMMTDFHLVRFDFKNGRFVKGFGQAYDIDDCGIKLVSSNPHKHK